MAHMLKEWSAVVNALEAGDQHILLRKGGILDAPSGFRLEGNRFWLYPTWEHQTPENVRARFRHHIRTDRPDDCTNIITSYAEVLKEADIHSDDILKRMEPLHIWSSQYVESRRNWKPQLSIKAVLVRVFRTTPATIPILDEYRGCRSWMHADIDMAGGRAVISDGQAAKNTELFGGITS